MEEMFAIKCQNCGGPMYSHQATRSFDCAYCGTSVPWEAGGQQPADTVGIRHQPIQMVDGLMKLTHVSQLEPAKDARLVLFRALLAQLVADRVAFPRRPRNRRRA